VGREVYKGVEWVVCIEIRQEELGEEKRVWRRAILE